MKGSDLKKYSGIAIIVGAVVLVMGILCFVVLGVTLGRISSGYGYKISASDAQEMLDQAEGMAQMLGGDMSDLLGISSFQLFLIKFALTMRIPLLVVGILLTGAGVALYFVSADPQTINRAKREISHGLSGASAALKGTIDRATTKCPACGKVCSSKTVFCPSCGTKTVKPETIHHAEETSTKCTYTCPKCRQVYSKKIAFCSACGQKMPDEVPGNTFCRSCGAENPSGAKFCSNCGNDLRAHGVDDICVPSPAPTAPEGKEADMPVPVVHTSTFDAPARPSVEVVPDKKNPFMSKPKDL